MRTITSFKLHLAREVLDDALAVDELLEEEAGDRDHRETAVLELLRGHLLRTETKAEREARRLSDGRVDGAAATNVKAKRQGRGRGPRTPSGPRA